MEHKSRIERDSLHHIPLNMLHEYRTASDPVCSHVAQSLNRHRAFVRVCSMLPCTTIITLSRHYLTNVNARVCVYALALAYAMP